MKQADKTNSDGERLQKLFDDLKASKGIGKAEFARAVKFPGGASMISQHLSGHRPISLDAAKAYMRGFACRISDISPDLAAQLPVNNDQFDLAQHKVQEPVPAFHQPSLGQTLADLSRHLSAMDQGTRRKAMALIADLVNEPESHTTVTAMIELSIRSKFQKAA